MGRYIDPRTDFGFKRLFGQEDSKDILKQFLLDILALPHPITELTYIPVEQLPASPEGRRGVYDIYCVDTMGRRFIVEMQQIKQSNIKERVLFYSTFAITYQAQRGTDWQFNLLPVYCIAILDFATVADDETYLRRIQLMDTNAHTVFYDKLTFVFIELAKFERTLADLSQADKWVYLLKHMPELQNIPAELAAASFQKVFAIAEEAALSPDERWLYEGSLKQARDAYAQLAYAHQEGLTEGIAQGITQGQEAGRQAERIELARSMVGRGLEHKLISELTGLSEVELKML